MKRLFKLIALSVLLLMLAGILCSCELLDQISFGKPSGGYKDDEDPVSPDESHTHIMSEWKSDSDGHYKECKRCGEKSESEEHITVTVGATPPTCGTEGLSGGEKCKICGFFTSKQNPVPATGNHSLVITGYKAPTFTDKGYSSGKQCTVCNNVFDTEGELPAAESARGYFAYNSLSSSGAKELYELYYEGCVDFHTDYTRDAKRSTDGDAVSYIAFEVDYSDYVDSADEAFNILYAMVADCPLFYWVSNTCLYNDTNLMVCVSREYTEGEARAEINEKIYEGLAAAAMPDGGSVYEKTLYLHNLIIDTMSYAYENDGVTPESDAWAYSIDGYFTRQSGVCEAYTEVFALYLNYWGVDNAQAAGMTETEAHAWNLVKLDNGEWYWFDLTWDDQPSWPMGRVYDYFCVTDSAMTGRSLNNDIYTLPDRAAEQFETEEIPMLGEKITNGIFTFLVIGSDQVQLMNENGNGKTVTVPESIEYMGRQYKVVCIADVRNNTAYNVFSYGVTTVNIPESVVSVEKNAFAVGSIERVNYGGTREMWERIAAELDLPMGCQVVCADD